MSGDIGHRRLAAGGVAYVYRLPEPSRMTFEPGTVTVNDQEIVVEGWTASGGADLNALGVHAIEWAIERLTDALP